MNIISIYTPNFTLYLTGVKLTSPTTGVLRYCRVPKKDGQISFEEDFTVNDGKVMTDMIFFGVVDLKRFIDGNKKDDLWKE